MIALVLIDQQKGIDNPRLGPRNNPLAEIYILKLLNTWRELEWPIFHVIHKSNEKDSVFWPEQSGFELKSEFMPKAGETLIEKSIPCAILNSSLAQELKKLKIYSFALVGASTNNSIEATARTGGNMGFKVYVVEEACFTFDKADFFGNFRSASEVHAMSLANLHGEYADVISCEQLLNHTKSN